MPSKVRSYYNEHDPFAAEWLRILILNDLIAEGDVDTRSIEDVTPSDIAGYTQCHFFAGIGGWSYALRLAGWPDGRPCWTLSCPCQPFSVAGEGGGFTDERHLWPAAHWLIAQRRPIAIFGEQVASPAGLNWFDTVYSDLEATAYSTQAVDICAASIGAPHIRQRLYFRADSRYARMRRSAESRQASAWRSLDQASGYGHFGVGSEPELQRRERWIEDKQQYPSIVRQGKKTYSRCEGVATGLQRQYRNVSNRGKSGWLSEAETRSATAAGRTRGFWSNADWWYGKDEKYRPIEPGLFPLAHGVSGRVGKLRGYGNAIVPPLAAAFIEATEGW